MNYQYTVVPFAANIRYNEGSQHAAQQLSLIINDHAEKGWEYVRMEEVRTVKNNGCLGSILPFMNATDVFNIYMLVFRAEKRVSN